MEPKWSTRVQGFLSFFPIEDAELKGLPQKEWRIMRTAERLQLIQCGKDGVWRLTRAGEDILGRKP